MGQLLGRKYWLGDKTRKIWNKRKAETQLPARSRESKMRIPY